MKISWTDHVKSGVLHRVEKERDILRKIKQKKAEWIDQILCKNCLLKQVIKERWKEG
jgi:hypothetical protein